MGQLHTIMWQLSILIFEKVMNFEKLELALGVNQYSTWANLAQEHVRLAKLLAPKKFEKNVY
jgi:hypothetical protein